MTHDPVETIILAIVVGVVALVYCGQVVSEPSSTELMSKAKELCGDRGLKSFRLKSKFGFGWKRGAAENEAGHTLDFEFECLPTAAAPASFAQQPPVPT